MIERIGGINPEISNGECLAQPPRWVRGWRTSRRSVTVTDMNARSIQGRTDQAIVNDPEAVALLRAVATVPDV